MKNKILAFVTLAIFLFSVIGNIVISADSSETLVLTYTVDLENIRWETNWDYMHDEDEDTYASTDEIDDEEKLGFSFVLNDLGEITCVDIQARGYWSGAQRNITLIPIFDRAPGDEHTFVLNNTTDWSGWIDITGDSNAHSYWTWDDITELRCLVRVGDGDSGFTVYCSIVQVRVTYIPD
jgi:hypothetical protein